MTRSHRIPLACSLLAALGLAVSASAADRNDVQTCPMGACDDSGRPTASTDFRAAHLRDGKDRTVSAKADVAIPGNREARRHDYARQGYANDRTATAAVPPLPQRAANMRDNKDATNAAKGADDWMVARQGAGYGPTQVADLGEFRAANMADHKTSLEPKAKTGGEESRIESSREDAGWQSGMVLNSESASDGPITDASATEARVATGPDSSAPATSAPRQRQGLWNSGHDAELSQAPAPVQATLDREAAGRDIHSLSAKVENGRTIYDARISRSDGDDLRLKVAEDGSIVWRNDLKEQATAPLIQPAETSSASTSTTVAPAPAGPVKAADADARPAISNASGSSDSAIVAEPSRSTPADQSRQDPSTARANAEVDEAKMSSLDTSDNSVHDTSAVPAATDTDGWLGLGSGNRVAIEEVPKAVKDAILREADGKAISRIDRDSEQGKTFYKARIRVDDGKDLKLKFAEDGTVVSRK